MTVTPDRHPGLTIRPATGPPVRCLWFDDEGKLLRETYDPSVLVQVPAVLDLTVSPLGSKGEFGSEGAAPPLDQRHDETKGKP